MPYAVERLTDESIVLVTLASPFDTQAIPALLTQTRDTIKTFNSAGFVIVDVSRMLIPQEELAQLLVTLYQSVYGDLRQLRPVVVGHHIWCECARDFFSQHKPGCRVPLFNFLPQAFTYARWRIANQQTLPGAGFDANDSAASATYG